MIKKKYVEQIRTSLQALNHELILKKVHIVIKLNQKAWLKPGIDMKTKAKHKKKRKNDFEKDLFKLMDKSVLGKTMENLKMHRDIKLLTTNKRRSHLISDPNYHTTKWFSENLLAIEISKTKVKMNNRSF